MCNPIYMSIGAHDYKLLSGVRVSAIIGFAKQPIKFTGPVILMSILL